MADDTLPEDAAAREAARVAAKKARKKTADALRYQSKKTEMNAKRMAHAKANPEQKKASDKRYYDRNRDAVLETKRDYYETNKDIVYPKIIAYQDANKDKIRPFSRVRTARHKARKVNAVGTHSVTDIQEIATQQKHRCAYCRCDIKNGYHVDHIVALSKGGRNDRKNLQLLCPPCNQKKSAKDPIAFARTLGRLI